MKLVLYGQSGQEKPGLIDEKGQLRDLSSHVRDIDGESLAPEVLDRLKGLNADDLSLVSDPQRLGPCVGNVGKLICVGLNYTDHAKEAGMAIPTEPVLFMKATSSIIGPNDDVEIPPDALKVDWEVELGIVIGKAGRYLSKGEALDHVAGYCVVNDVSERAYQLERNGQWDKGKSCDTFGPIGPWMVTRDEVPDPHALDIWLEVDGQRYQNGSTANMIFDVATIVSYISQFMSLQAGDVIATGTPAGVGLGQKPAPVFLRAGQTMHLGISGLGVQRQLAVSSKATSHL